MSKTLIFTLLLLGCGGLLPAQEYFVIDRFDVQIRLDEEDYFEVTETLDVQFSEPRHGIFRSVPFRYRVEGKRYDIDLDDIEVEGRPYETKREGGELRIRIGHPDRYVDGEQRYIIRYRVRGAWLFEEEHTEFYWNLTGNNWPVPIGETTFRIEFPPGLSLTEADYRLFTGYAGTRGDEAEARLEGDALTGRSTAALAPGEGLTVAVRLPVDFVDRPTAFEVFMKQYGLLGLPLALLGLLGWVFFRHGQEDDFVEMAHYYPPEDLPPAEAGAFIDDKTHNRDIIALIPYWAGQGFLNIREVETKKLLIFSDTDFEFIKLQELPADRPGYEHLVFNRLFRDGDRVMLSDLKDEFHQTMSSARSQVNRAVRNRQLHTTQSRFIWQLLPLGASLCAGLGILFVFLEQFPAAIGMFVAAVAGFALRRPMLKKNKEGMSVYQQLYGFRLFVDKADRDRIERLLADDPAYFERTLPYAIAFGMAGKWAGQFEGLFTEPPRWYIAPHLHHGRSDGFHAFATNFDSSMREVQSVFTSAPSSSGSGGFSGGSSGGGFGGGGGGSW